MDKKKRKGGAERLREKKKKLLKEDAEKCVKLDKYFKDSAVHKSASESVPSTSSDARDEHLSEGENIAEVPNVNVTVTAIPGARTSSQVKSQVIESDSEFDLFIKPEESYIDLFFKKHPQQPSEKFENLPFSPSKVFFCDDGSQRMWLSFDIKSQRLFCTVCLVFCKSIDQTSFCTGVNDWRHVHQRISEHEASTVHSRSTESYFMRGKNRDIKSLVWSRQTKLRNEQVKKRRQILERIIDIIKVIGKRGLSFRGKRNEAAYSLDDSSLDHGTFLELIILLSKYDAILKEHLTNVISKSNEAKAKYESSSGKRGRGNLMTFLSNNTATLIIDTISSFIKKHIANEIKSAKFFSVQIDTTQDISVKDQCSVVVRYVFNGEIKESLLALKTCSDSTGKGLMDLLQSVFNENELDVKNCIGNATDGAANMRGQYNGFTTWLTKSSPEQVHVWCYSHILNLVLSDCTKSPISVATFFEILNSAAIFFKESHKRMDIWRLTGNKKLQAIGETRWWAKNAALTKIFGCFESYQNGLYIELIVTLCNIEDNESFSADIRAKARNLKQSFLKYETILLSQIYLKIFSITEPLSNYLQTQGLDILKAQQLVSVAIHQLKIIQRDFRKIKLQSDKFVEWANEQFVAKNVEEEVEDCLPPKRTRRVKKMSGELLCDNPVEDETRKFEVEVYNMIMDTIVESMRTRFENNRELYMDLHFLAPASFPEIKNGQMPKNALTSLCEKLKNIDLTIDINILQNELISFAHGWDKLKTTTQEEYVYYRTTQNDELDLSSDSDDDDCDRAEDILHQSAVKCSNCKNCAICCFSVLMQYNLYSKAYKHLTLAYKYLLTLPITQVACERTFSVLKFLKNRIRNALSDHKLEAFLLMSVEKSVLSTLDSDDIIDKVAEHSELLRKKLSREEVL